MDFIYIESEFGFVCLSPSNTFSQDKGIWDRLCIHHKKLPRTNGQEILLRISYSLVKFLTQPVRITTWTVVLIFSLKRHFIFSGAKIMSSVEETCRFPSKSGRLCHRANIYTLQNLKPAPWAFFLQACVYVCSRRQRHASCDFLIGYSMPATLLAHWTSATLKGVIWLKIPGTKSLLGILNEYFFSGINTEDVFHEIESLTVTDLTGRGKGPLMLCLCENKIEKPQTPEIPAKSNPLTLTINLESDLPPPNILDFGWINFFPHLAGCMMKVKNP